MEVEDTDTTFLKKRHLENGDSSNDDHNARPDETSERSHTKIAICNGGSRDKTNESDKTEDIMENGDNLKDSDLDSHSNADFERSHDDNDRLSDEDSAVKMDTEYKSDKDDTSDNGGAEDEDSQNIESSEKLNKSIAEIEESGEDENESKGDEDERKDECDNSSKNVSEENADDDDDDEEMPDIIKEGTIEEINDSEKENKSSDLIEPREEIENSASDEARSNEIKESSDDVEIIGESKLVKIDSPSVQSSSPQSVILMTSGVNHNFSTSSSSIMASPNSFSPGGMPVSNISSGYMMNGRGPSTPMSLLSQGAHAPPKPKSSLDQIELIRWEIQNRLNTRPKYFKPNPSAELGPLAKFLFDIGSNLIKEAVYHELVKIQSKKNEENTLSEKEKEDLDKLKDIERDLHSTIGHLKLKMRKKCKVCHFQTESGNVIYHHKQFPHEDSKNLHCAYCTFVTKQPMTFKFHLESEHGVQPRLHDKKAFYECDLCPYENNQEQKLNVHKQRCAKQFRPLFNLHPSCLSGAEINLCLENIFYKPVVPKNLKILQQKHAQQQAALAEARRQQAEVQALAAQKNAAALAAKKQRQITLAPGPQRYNSPNTRQFPQRSQGQTMSAVRYNSRQPNPAPLRPTVASMLKDKQVRPIPHVSPAQQNSAPGGFEVCEICGGYVKDRKALRIHFFYAHRIDLPFNLFDRNQPPLYCATCYVRFWTAQGLRKHIDIHVQEKKIPEGFMGEGVHGKCISCGQLVGNIVVHMRVVHNREIHHYINALMCMFCGASFNSRPNVERHITEVHGTIDIATGSVKVKAKLKSSLQQPRPSTNQKKSSGGKDSLVKGSVCVLCNLNFGRNVDLTRHCMRMHHTCMKCGMVVIDKASLLKHTCLSSPSGTRDCTMCSETGFHPAYYVKHLRDKHLKKFSITVARVSAPIIEKWIKRPYPFKARQDDPVEISDSEEEVAPEIEAPSPIPVDKSAGSSQSSPRKKVKIGPASRIGRQQLAGNGAMISPSGSKRKMSVETTPERMSKRRK